MTESAAGRTGRRRWEEERSRPASHRLPARGPEAEHFTHRQTIAGCF